MKFSFKSQKKEKDKKNMHNEVHIFYEKIFNLLMKRFIDYFY